MSRRGTIKAAVCFVMTALVGLSLGGAPARADEAEPVVTVAAWYWEDKQSQEITGPGGEKIVIETPNPFCPGPGSSLGDPEQTCAPQRLPVQIRNGDYETPNMLSAVTFDFSLVPPESEVTDFTVTFLEAEAGCRETGNPPPNNVQCEQTNPINIERKKLQACEVTEIFGEGDAVEYRAIPKHKCTSVDPLATRKQVKNTNEKDDEDPDHVWTFDLTPFAQKWVNTFSVSTSILITAAPPKEQGGQEDNWRVVLAGPKVKDGVDTSLTFEPPPEEEFGGGGGGGTDPGVDTGTDFGSTDTGFGSTDTGFGSTDTGGPTGTDTGTGTGEAPVDASGDGGDEEPAAALGPETWPWYMWVAILAGLIGFSLVRSAVVEAATGIRPDGVLAQIRRINEDRRGAPVDAGQESTGALSTVTHAVGTVGKKISGLVGKLRPGGKE